jgi:predicted DsbA family dithiol-disulfide isomerase
MQLGATGTPAFFINGKKLTGAQPIDKFKRIIDAELSKAQAAGRERHASRPGLREASSSAA